MVQLADDNFAIGLQLIYNYSATSRGQFYKWVATYLRLWYNFHTTILRLDCNCSLTKARLRLPYDIGCL
jgi:hypothetical protein